MSSRLGRPDYKWQAKAQQAFAAEYFQLDWQKQQLTCPEGKMSTSWSAYTHPNGKEMVKIKFAQKDCIAGPSTKLKSGVRRSWWTTKSPLQGNG